MQALSKLLAFQQPSRDAVFSSSGEGSSFLALYSKRNSPHANVNEHKGRDIKGLESDASDANIAPHVDFKRILMPLLLQAAGKVLRSDRHLKVDRAGGKAVHEDKESANSSDAYDASTQSGLVDPAQLVSVPNDAQWQALNQLRIHAGAPERTEQGAEKLISYYAQLTYLEEKFSFETQQIPMQFTWYESCFPKKKIVTNCIQYEKACVLFNLGAVFCQLGTIQTIWTADGVKLAASYFQRAAGALMHVRDALLPRLQIKVDKFSDLSDHTLTAAATLMLAQAHECYYEKANQDKSSSHLTSQIAATTSDYYEEAARAATSGISMGKMRFPKMWPAQMESRALMFLAIAHFHAPSEAEPEYTLAERITRLSVARALLEQAEKTARGVGGSALKMVQFYQTTVEGVLHQADQINFEEYHQTVPSSKYLPSPKRLPAPLVAPKPLTGTSGQNDLFAQVVGPLSIDDVKAYIEEVDHMRRMADMQITAFKEEIESKLSTLALNSDRAVAESFSDVTKSNILEDAKACQLAERTFGTADMLGHIKKLHSFINCNVNQASSILRDVDTSSTLSDPSTIQTIRGLQRSVTKMHEEMKTRRDQLDGLQQIYETNITDFQPLTWTEVDLYDLMPSLNPASSMSDPDRQELRQMLEEHKSLMFSLKSLLKESQRIQAEIAAFSDTQMKPVGTMEDREKGRQQMRDFGRAIDTLHMDKGATVWKLNHLTTMIEHKGKDILNHGDCGGVIDAFKRSIKEYNEFRRDCQAVIDACRLLREQSVHVLLKCLEQPQKEARLPVRLPAGSDPLLAGLLDRRPPPDTAPAHREHDSTNQSGEADGPAKGSKSELAPHDNRKDQRETMQAKSAPEALAADNCEGLLHEVAVRDLLVHSKATCPLKSSNTKGSLNMLRGHIDRVQSKGVVAAALIAKGGISKPTPTADVPRGNINPNIVHGHSPISRRKLLMKYLEESEKLGTNLDPGFRGGEPKETFTETLPGGEIASLKRQTLANPDEVGHQGNAWTPHQLNAPFDRQRTGVKFATVRALGVLRQLFRKDDQQQQVGRKSAGLAASVEHGRRTCWNCRQDGVLGRVTRKPVAASPRQNEPGAFRYGYDRKSGDLFCHLLGDGHNSGLRRKTNYKGKKPESHPPPEVPQSFRKKSRGRSFHFDVARDVEADGFQRTVVEHPMPGCPRCIGNLHSQTDRICRNCCKPLSNTNVSSGSNATGIPQARRSARNVQKHEDIAKWAADQSHRLLVKKGKKHRILKTKRAMSVKATVHGEKQQYLPVYPDQPASVVGNRRLSTTLDYGGQIAASCNSSVIGGPVLGGMATAPSTAGDGDFDIEPGLRDAMARMKGRNKRMIERMMTAQE